jgi:hypothetical protein
MKREDTKPKRVVVVGFLANKLNKYRAETYFSE